MEAFIKDYICLHHFFYDPIPEQYLSNIYNLYHDNIHNEVEHDVVLLYYGIYHNINQNYDIMKEYYSRAMALGLARAGYQLGLYYHRTTDILNAQKYLLWAIEHLHVQAMHAFAIYYCRDDFNKAMKYLLQAAELGYAPSMNHIIFQYYKTGDIHGIVKYEVMAFEHGDYSGCESIVRFCATHGQISYLVLLLNKLLNKQWNYMIVDTVMKLTITDDLLNVLINIESNEFPVCAHLLHLFI